MTRRQTSIDLSDTTRRQLADLGGQLSETIRRAVAVLWTLEVEAPRRLAEVDPTDPHGTQRR